MRLFHVDRPGASAVPTAPRPKTPIIPMIPPAPDPAVTAGTSHGTATGPGRGTWPATSDDGLWHYVRDPTNPPQVTVTFVPTGQTATIADLDRAREATFDGTLLAHLRGQAYLAAYNKNATRADRAAGQRLLALHLRAAGDTDVSTSCHRCGGMLTTATRDGRRHAHVDACDTCATGLPDGRCPHAAEHRFCGDPDPVLTTREAEVLDFANSWWKRRGAKEQAIHAQLGMTAITYYAMLNRIIDMPDAVRRRPQLVRSLLKLRRSRDFPGSRLPDQSG